MKISVEEDQPFRLLDLPPEIWSRICRIVVADHPSLPAIWSWTWNKEDAIEYLRQPIITRVCRVLREETLPIFYASREIRFSDDGDEEPLLADWLNSIDPANRRHLTRLTLRSYWVDLPERYNRLLEPLGLKVQLPEEHPKKGLEAGWKGHQYFVSRTHRITQIQPFRLLDLPPEIWSRICRLAMAEDTEPFAFLEWDPKTNWHDLHQPSITRVCKILREDTLPLFYDSKEIYCGCGDVESPPIIAWLQNIGPANRRYLKKLRLVSAYVTTPEKYSAMLAPLGLGVRLLEPNAWQVARVDFDRHATWQATGSYVHSRSYLVVQLDSADATPDAANQKAASAAEGSEGDGRETTGAGQGVEEPEEI